LTALGLLMRLPRRLTRALPFNSFLRPIGLCQHRRTGMVTQGDFGGSSKRKRPAAAVPPGVAVTKEGEAYSFVATLENVAVRLVPTVPSTVTAATAIRAAIRPYSIAVAPSSFFRLLAETRISEDRCPS